MQGSVWIDMLRRIPADLHNTLVLGLVTGEEVVVQQLIKMEAEFAIVRGRMAGTTAEGRIMMVPYCHLTVVAINKRITEPEVQAMFGVSALPTSDAAPPSPASAQPSAAAAPPVKPESSPQLPLPKSAAAAGASGQPKPPPPSKSILLARLRERLAEKSKSS